MKTPPADPQEPAEQLSLTLDSPLFGRVKNDRTVMVFNFFSLYRKPTRELRTYDDGEVRIEVSGTKHGVANIWDKELLIYIASLLQEKLNRAEPVSRRISFTASDYFRVCQTNPGGTSYERLKQSLLRLQGTQIKTNIETGGEGEDGSFSWLADFKIRYRRNELGEKDMRGVTVEICDWLYRAIVKDQHMLTYDARYFQLSPMERRLYEIARAHCGRQNSFRMNLEKLQRKVGSDSPPKLFKSRLMAISKRGQVPEYAFVLWDPRQNRLGLGSPPPRGRMPVRGWQVFFFRKDRPGLMSPPEQAPLVEDS